MKAILAQLIAAAIDADKIPDLDFFDMRKRADGEFRLRLNDGSSITIKVDLENAE